MCFRPGRAQEVDQTLDAGSSGRLRLPVKPVRDAVLLVMLWYSGMAALRIGSCSRLASAALIPWFEAMASTAAAIMSVLSLRRFSNAPRDARRVSSEVRATCSR
jgi:hypothetical protein